MGSHKVPAIGDKFEVRPTGFVTVVEYVDAKHVKVADDAGNSKWMLMTDVRNKPKWLRADGSLYKSKRTAKVQPKVKRELRTVPVPDGHYVYIVTLDGAVVYVGRGKGLRYMHCYSGRSCSRELNRLYFLKAPVIVEVWEQGLDKEQAKFLEKQMIAHFKPRCNEIHYKV